MKYRFEYCGNRDYVSISVTERLIDSDWVSDLFHENAKDAALWSLLKSANGVTEISLRPYEISAKRGKAFERDEVLAALLDLLLIHLKMESVIRTDEQPEQLPTVRSDIRQVLCRQCEREQQAEIKRSMKEFERLDY